MVPDEALSKEKKIDTLSKRSGSNKHETRGMGLEECHTATRPPGVFVDFSKKTAAIPRLFRLSHNIHNCLHRPIYPSRGNASSLDRDSWRSERHGTAGDWDEHGESGGIANGS